MKNFVDEFKVKLEMVNLGHYLELFERERLTDKEMLASITENDLEKIGVSTLGDRKTIMKIFHDFSLEIDSSTQQSEEAKNNMLLFEFIDTRVEFYKKAFVKYTAYGTDQFAFVWSWCGFLCPSLNLLYRKQYLAGIIWFIANSLINILGPASVPISIILTIIQGLCGAVLNPYLVYKRYSITLAQCNQQKLSHEKTRSRLRNVGGTNSLIVFLFVLINIGTAILSSWSAYSTIASVLEHY